MICGVVRLQLHVPHRMGRGGIVSGGQHSTCVERPVVQMLRKVRYWRRVGGCHRMLMCGERVRKKGKARPEALGVAYRRGDTLKTV